MRPFIVYRCPSQRCSKRSDAAKVITFASPPITLLRKGVRSRVSAMLAKDIEAADAFACEGTDRPGCLRGPGRSPRQSTNRVSAESASSSKADAASPEHGTTVLRSNNARNAFFSDR